MISASWAGFSRFGRALAAGVIGLAASFAPARATQTVLGGVTGLQRVARLTGENSINRTDSRWNVAGTDLGHMFDMDGALYMVFGDTFGHGFVAPPGAGPAPDWRSNVMAVTTDRDPSDGLTFDAMIADANGDAKELLHPRRDLGVITDIPTNGVAAGGRMYLHYMAVSHWGAPGEWTLHHAGLAVSDDHGNHWTKLAWQWAGGTKFGQVAFVRDGGYVYLIGIPGGRNGGACVARVSEWSVATQTAYRYYAGESGGAPVWSASESDAVTVVPAPVGELSMMWNGFLKRWTMMYLMGPNIVIRESPTLLGPWSAPITVVRASAYPGLYAPYMHPWLVENDGETIYFTMSEWGTYGVSLMKARLLRRADAPTMADVARALALSGGLAAATPADALRLGGAGPVGIPRAASLLRRVTGLE
jgi:hypothetical protein